MRERNRPAAPARPQYEPSGELASVMDACKERFGPTIMRRAAAVPGFTHLDLGIFTLDFALLGGIPEGLVAQIYGWESSGKSTIASRVIASAQRKHGDKAAVFLDAEGTYDNTWGAAHGVDNDRLFLVQPESGEQAVDIMDAVLRAEETSLVVLDSLPALVPQAEIDSSAEDSLVAKRSQLIGRMCSKILAATLDERKRQHFPTVILINQFRMKIGVTHGDPRTLPGGMQPKYLATTMIEMKNKEVMGRDSRDTEVVDHNDHSFVVKKCKVGNSLRSGEFTMVRNPDNPLGVGAIDDYLTVCNFAKKFGLITGGGQSWYVDGIDRKFGKRDEIIRFLTEDDEEYVVLKRKLIAMQRVAMGLSELPPDHYLLGPVG